MRNKAKLSKKDAKQNSKLDRLSETKQNKARMTQFRLHEPPQNHSKPKRIMRKVSQFRMFRFKAKQAKLAHFSHVSFWFRSIFRGSSKRN
jgi:hypothetical protein